MRAMEDRDADAVAAIEEASLGAWGGAEIEAEIGRQGSLCFVVELDGAVVGFAVCRLPCSDEAEIHLLAVAEAQRRRGLGRGLLHHVIEALGARGVGVAFLMVRESNLAARSLYRKTGFRETRRSRLAYASPAEDGIELALRLAGVAGG